MNIITRFKLLYPQIAADDGKILLEFGLTSLMPGGWNIIVRGQRCMEKLGLCLYVHVLNNVWTKLEHVRYKQMSEYVKVDITLELHQSNFVLLSFLKKIYTLNTSNDLCMDDLYPVFGFYNTHLINISQTVYSKKEIRFNDTTVDPHLFISEDSTTISTCKLPDKGKPPSFWGSVLFCIPIAVFTACIYSFSRTYNEPIRSR